MEELSTSFMSDTLTDVSIPKKHHKPAAVLGKQQVINDNWLEFNPDIFKAPLKKKVIAQPQNPKAKMLTAASTQISLSDSQILPSKPDDRIKPIIPAQKYGDYLEFREQVSQIFEDLAKLQEVYKNIVPGMTLDMMFIIDCTGSMEPWIEACKSQVRSIINSVKEQYSDIYIQLSIVAYRDHCDGAAKSEIFPFSSDITACEAFLTNLRAFGGGDGPEDVTGGFENALNADWNARSRYAILLADAPAHGEQYHLYGGNYDDYPQGDPQGRKIEDQIKQFAKKKIYFSAIKIARSTEVMFKILDENYKKAMGRGIQFADLGQSTLNFNLFVTQSVSQSITLSQMDSDQTSKGSLFSKITKLQSQGQYSIVLSFIEQMKSRKQDIEKDQQSEQLQLKGKMKDIQAYHEKQALEELQNLISQQQQLENAEEKKELYEKQLVSLKIKKLDSTIKRGKIFSAICHSWFIVKDKGVPINWRKPLLQKSQIQSQIKIAYNPFAEGAMRYAFMMEDQDLKEKYVVKVPKDINPITYNLEEMKNDIEAMFICTHIVNEFNEKIISTVDTKYLVEFVHSFIYEILDQNSKLKYYYGENFIDGKYEKYNNNAGWLAQAGKKQDVNQIMIAQALSHFSWQITEGYLMIVDLQGVGNVLTDPQIHCLDKHRFGKGNLGYQGMLMFFNTHQCNQHCISLGLINPKITKGLKDNFKLIKNPEEIQDTRGHTFINKLCDLCRKPFKTLFWHYQKQRDQGFEIWCDPCTMKRNKTFKKADCSVCGNQFKSSAYWFIMKKTDFPDKCSACRLANRERMRLELEENLSQSDTLQP